MSLPSRDTSVKLFETYIKNPNLRQHCLMVADALEAYAKSLGEDEELWYQTGLLHDLDWEQFPDEHPKKALTELLIEYPAELLSAVAAHAPARTGVHPESRLDKYLFACDELSGFLNAVSLMRPTGFDGMKPKSVKKKLKDSSFAAGVSRNDIHQGVALIESDLDSHIEFLISVFSTK